MVRTEGVVVVALSGDIDFFVLPRLDRELGQLLDVERDGVLCDLTQTTFADSFTVHWLLRLAGRLRDRNGGLVLKVARESVAARIIAVLNLDLLLWVVDEDLHNFRTWTSPAALFEGAADDGHYPS